MTDTAWMADEATSTDDSVENAEIETTENEEAVDEAEATEPEQTADDDSLDLNETAEDEDSAKNKAKTQAQSKGRDKTLIRRTVRKMVEVQGAEGDVLHVAASLLGKEEADVEGLVVTILTGDARKTNQPMSDLEDLMEADAIEMSANATALGKDRLKALWSLLGDLGKAEGALPAGIAPAAIQISKIISKEVSDEDMLTLAAVADLMKKA
ncbi:hypothetical protein GCM10009689_17070 [Brevibacterium antiquum]|uniref:hypothetical protein n=1 Tax=Brevibacterium antiquum TaxID=234835 RepID=UPI0018DF4015|nr:hypothetical protein [Brevibacterium antiquum]